MWLIPKSCHCVAESPGSNSASVADSNTSAAGPEWWVTASGTATRRPASWRGWKMRAWSRLLSSAVTSPTWTPALCGATSMESPPASPANPTAPPANGSESPTRDGSGRPLPESFAKLNPDGSFSKTSAASCPGAKARRSPKCSATWPVAGSMLNGVCYRREKLELRTVATECSFWPTATAQDGDKCSHPRRPGDKTLSDSAAKWQTVTAGEAKDRAYQYDNHDKGKPRPSLTGEAAQWATPNTARRGTEAPASREQRQSESGGGCSELLTEAEFWQQPVASRWPTPCAGAPNDGESPESWLARREELKAKGTNGNGAGLPLAVATEVWATPNAMGGGSTSRGGDRIGEPLLGGQTANWPTPNARDHKGMDLASRSGGSSLSHQVEAESMSHFSHPAPAWVALAFSMTSESFSLVTLDALGSALKPSDETPPAGSPSSNASPGSRPPSARKRLNPLFVNWLMGWPALWTRAEPINCGAEATESYRSKLRSRLSSLCGGHA